LPDYYSVLRRAVAGLNPNTTEARHHLYDRARRMLADQFGADIVDHAKFEAETLAFDKAVERIEAAIAASPSHQPYRQNDPSSGPVARRGEDGVFRSGRVRWRPLVAGGLCLAAGIAVMFAGYQFLNKPTSPAPHADNSHPPGGVQEARSTDTDEELAPGIDGGSTDAGLPYYLRRQPVYYRTVYSEGMILIDRSQRFLYLVQPKVVALRYGIGIGSECSPSAGLRHVTQKLEWPEWVPSPGLLKRQVYPPRLIGGPGNPLGARLLALDGNVLGIHGTNAPMTIGHAVTLGCFRMVNDDIVDLYQRVSTGASAVIMN
jgi:lipoprotein-anchoring transpeptidase ErfK/SrfK